MHLFFTNILKKLNESSYFLWILDSKSICSIVCVILYCVYSIVFVYIIHGNLFELSCARDKVISVWDLDDFKKTKTIPVFEVGCVHLVAGGVIKSRQFK